MNVRNKNQPKFKEVLNKERLSNSGCKSVADERRTYKCTPGEETPIEKSIMAGNHDFQPLFNENVI